MIRLGRHARRQASGTGAETAPEILESPDGTRLGTPPRSLGARVGGAVAGGVAGGAAGRALRPVARKAARRYGLPEGALVRATEIVAPILVSMAVARLVKSRARARLAAVGTGPDEPPGPIRI
ncbi:hypothetical protein GCM10010191_33600 [Actinomadura vinacea]|uniref:DUF4235 domain-containing protein n=1 Tax=Actinomadura vinacea TaxID=115336 RepID=A0ABN3J377_9ACTN